MKDHFCYSPVCKLIIFFIVIIYFSSCKKDPLYFSNNTIPYYNEVPTVKIENYVNRIFIDLIGREPLDNEMLSEVLMLKQQNLSVKSREELIDKLQTNSVFIEGDSSYKHAYYQRLYDLLKIRFIEGASNSEINQIINILSSSAYIDSLQDDTINMEKKKHKIEKLNNVIISKHQYMNGEIDYVQITKYMIDNEVYDVINMNTFNFINATFNDLYFRYPTNNEFYKSYDMIEYNLSRTLFEKPGQNKGEYINIITSCREFYEGTIRWLFITLVAREPNDTEINALMESFYNDNNFQKVQKEIMLTNEYANF